jgi:dolichyl-phosphate-mannose-protein mannosyltransferase
VTSARLAWTRADTLAIALVTGTAALLRSIHLTRPSVLVFDEFFYAREACFSVYRSVQTCGIGEGAVSPHPPLGKWLISLGIRALGYDPLGWRIAALGAGVLTVSLLYLLARRLLGSRVGATMAAGLLAIDPLHLVHSRVAMLDVFVTLFVVAGFLFLVIDRDPSEVIGRASPARRGIFARPWLVAAGAAMGAAAATKWVGFLALLGVAALSMLWAASRQDRRTVPKRIGAAAREEGWQLVVAMVIAPIVVYVVCFAGRIEGSLLSLPWSRGSWVRDFVGVQKAMLQFHLGIQDVSPYTSPAWSWPLIRRPVVYFQEATGGRYREILAMGSPVVWWASLPAIAYLGIQAARRRRAYAFDAAVVAVGGFAVLYLPWLAVTSERSFTFLFYLLPAVPFMCLAIAVVATPWVRSFGGRTIVALFCALAVASFAFFYPVLTATPLSVPAVEARRWFTDCRPPPGTLAPSGWCWR